MKGRNGFLRDWIHRFQWQFPIRTPVAFSLMEDDSRQAEAEFVFNIALKSNDDQLGMLNKIIGTVQDEKLLKDAKTMSCSSLENELQRKWTDQERRSNG